MSTSRILLLGAIAGFTIFLGLPVGRLRNLGPKARAFLNAVATGVLLFLFVDVMGKGLEPVESAVHAASQTNHGSWLTVAVRGALFVVAFGVGLLGLVFYDRWLLRRERFTAFGPGAASVGELTVRRSLVLGLSPAQRLALFIALGIGLHNFAEGLAIGQSAASGEIQLAVLLIVGFGLHNATEGFGIVAPLSAESILPSWGFLFAMGLIGGGPTFVGTLVGQAWVNETLGMVFLALAGGSILYVVLQLVRVGQKLGQEEMLMLGILVGLFMGFATDFVLVAAGA
ncbi:MAG: ZIP family metal transporter [Acidimicrobiia bacterium]